MDPRWDVYHSDYTRAPIVISPGGTRIQRGVLRKIRTLFFGEDKTSEEGQDNNARLGRNCRITFVDGGDRKLVKQFVYHLEGEVRSKNDMDNILKTV